MPDAQLVADHPVLVRVGPWAVLGLLLLLGGCAHVGPAEVPGSPTEKRLAVVKGTTPGITLLPARRAGAGPDAAVSTSAMPASAPASASAVDASAGAAFSLRRLLGGLAERLGPPTGRPLAEQKRLDAPDQGIPLPTAGSGTAK